MGLALVLCASASVADDGTPAAAPPVDSLVAEALRRAPDLAAARAREAAAHARTGVAATLADPMVEVAWQDAGFPDWTVGEEDMSMLEFEVRQELPWFGKRGARRRAAAAETLVAQADRRSLERQIATDVRWAYAELYALDRKRAALANARSMLQLVTSSVSARYAAGETDLAEPMRTQIAVSRLEERDLDLGALREQRVAALNALLDRPCGTPLGEVRWVPETQAPAADFGERAMRTSPAVDRSRATAAVATERTALEQSERWPDVWVGAAYGARGSLNPVVTFRAGTELPLWRGRRQGALGEAAAADAAAAEHDARRAAIDTRAAAERWTTAWRAADAQVRLYRDALLPQSSAALDAARTAYGAGRGDLAQVIGDFTMWVDVQAGLAEREAARFGAWAELDALAGSPAAAAELGSAVPAPPDSAETREGGAR